MDSVGKERVELITTSVLIDMPTLAGQGITYSLWDKYLPLSKGKINKQRGEFVLKIGQCLDGLYYVYSGRIISNLLGRDGSVKTINITSAGCPFGEQFIFHEQPSIFEAISMEESELYFFDKQTILDLIRQDFDLNLLVLKSMALRARKLAVQLEDMSMRNITQNLCRILYTLCCYQVRENEVNAEIEIDISHQILANMLASHRVTVSKNMKKLNELGIIECKYEKIIVKNCLELKRIAFE